MLILGISAFYHDSAAALICNGDIVAAAQEERFTRKKHDAGFPQNAIEYCLQEASVEAWQLDYVVFYDKPLLKFDRLLETYLAFVPRGFNSFRTAIPQWLQEKLFLKGLLQKRLKQLSSRCEWENKILFSEHHISHAASAFYPSPFKEAAVLTMDGVGEWATTSLAIGRGEQLTIEKEIHFPHSLGLLYSAFTYYTGFKVNSGEYKVMGLAPYGNPRYAKKILDHLIDIKPDGTFRLDMSYFNYCTGLTMTNRKFQMLFDGVPPRSPESPLTQREMDLAASIQQVTEEIILRLTRSISQETRLKNLCLAGGVALNCVANGKVLRDGHFENIWIQPAAGDAGGALGAALAAYYLHAGQKRADVPCKLDAMKGSYLGPEYTQRDIEGRLDQVGASYVVLDEARLLQACTATLDEGKALGWFQGRMEFGPRALGARSILGDARSPNMQSLLNQKVKFRESFRPFAPSVLREDLADYFDIGTDSPYMLLVADIVRKRRIAAPELQEECFGIDRIHVSRSDIPAVTHVDYSARIQTVHRETNPRYHALISAFKEKTGCAVIVNTSFNIRGEPIVCTPEDAFRCFMATDIDALAVGNCFLLKNRQNMSLCCDYRNAVEQD
jgi:carbamoyltransferase